ncbi:hypothetical protein CIN_16880 [Commensalibacter intestini A911]|uniref:Uncharacterized protein n=1 Tax=Commensalibacter intestini A911 TaxID=1088868 RepID=G6F242_9PROT|nr:hemagglutinin repeat-containing protein [Commensalibacter intestini]EHD13496.1 hypothetical protein CIN_16880 [Commensalibacter intestini A911]
MKIFNIKVNRYGCFVNAQNNLTLDGQNLTNNGEISSATGTIKATINGDISNNNGKIAANNSIDLDATGNMSNQSGQIVGNQAASIHIKANNLNNQNGLIQTNTGIINLEPNSLNNDAGSIVTTNANITINASEYILNNNNAQIGSEGSGDIDLITQNTLQNNNSKILTNSGNISINSNKLLNNSGVIIAGMVNNAGDLVLHSGDVDNSNGTLQATNGSVDAHIGNYTDTGNGVFYAGNNLTINASGDMSVGGAIQSQNQFTLNANNLNLTNKNAAVSSLNGNGSLTIVNDLINNGNISFSKGSLALDTGSFGNYGSIDIGVGGFNFNVKGNFSNRNGSLVTDASDVTITALDGTVDNTNGQIGVKTNGNVTINSQDLWNEGGLIRTTTGAITLNVNTLDNQNGSILITTGKFANDADEKRAQGAHLQINASQNINNTAGKIAIQESGNIGITANNGNIYNEAIGDSSGHIVTADSAIDLNASGNIDNSNAGQIGSQESNSVTLSGQALNNQNGLIRTNDGDLTLTIGSLDNSNSGAILTTTGNILVDASQGILNTLGKIGVEQQGNVTVNAKTGDLNNTQGKILTTSGLLDVDVYNLYNNSSGQIGSKNGAIDITFKHLVNNSGVILAENNSTLVDSTASEGNWGSVALHGGDVDNSNGTIQATRDLVLANISSYTDTSSGVLYAGKKLTLSASGNVSIANVIQSQGDTVLSANQLTLTNKEASVSSLQGNVSLNNINEIINNGSIYASRGSLNIQQGGILENSGAVYGKQLVKLDLTQSIKNNGVIVDSKLDNGLIQSDGNVLLTASSLENTGFIQSIEGYITLAISGDIYNQSLADSTDSSGVIKSGGTDKDGYGQYITITADNLQNTNGRILSDTDLTLNIQNTLTNGGYLQANKATTLVTPNLKNNGGAILALGGNLSIGSSETQTVTAAIDNSNGKIQANGNIVINGSSYQSSDKSFLTAQQQLQANFTGDAVNNGQMVAGSDLTFTANSLSNGKLGLIYSEIGNVSLTVLGQGGISNFGNIRSIGTNTQLLMNTSTLANQGTILSANSAALTISQQLNNQRDQSDPKVFGKIITQGGDLTINAPTVVNAGLIITPNNLTITTQTMNNTGYVSADSSLTVNASHSIVAQAASSGLSYDSNGLGNDIQTLVSGSFVGGTVNLSSQDITSQNGWIQGKNSVTLTANTIENTQQSVLLSTNGDVTLQGIGSTTDNILPVSSVKNTGSNIQAYNRIWIATQNLDNTNGVLTSESGNIRLDQGSSGSALQSFNNAGGTLQSSQDLTLNFSQLDSAEGSKILAGGLLSLTIGSDFTNNGTLWGGKGLSLTVSSLTNSANNVIGADSGNVTINAKNGDVTNYGVIKNLDSNAGSLLIQAQNLMNDNGSILSNSNINLQISQNLTNQNNGEITAYNQGNIVFTGSSFNNAYLMLAGGTITGSVSGDINNNANGYIYGESGLTLTSNGQITNSTNGQIGTGTGDLSLTASTLSFAQNGQIISSGGKISLNASSGMSNNGWLQGMGDIQITTPTLDNSNGTIVSMQGGMTIQKDQNGNGLTSLNNNNGTLQSTKNLTIYTDKLQSQNGKILTYDALGKGNVGDVALFANAQNGVLTTLDLSNDGIIQSSKDIDLAAQSSALSATGTIIANQTLNAVLEGDFSDQNMLFSSLGVNQDAGVNFTVHGNYTTNENGGLTSRGNLVVNADTITNNGVLLALNTMTVNTGSLTNNKTGVLSSTNDMTITTSGDINNNQGVIQSDQGSMTIDAKTGDVNNIGGLIRTQGAYGDITLTARSFTNKYFGNLETTTFTDKLIAKYDTAINAAGQAYAGMTNKEVTNTYTITTGVVGLGQYYYSSDVKILKVAAPEGLYTTDGKPASGYVYYFLSGGAGNPNTRVEITATGTQTTLNGTSAIISAGRDLTIVTTGAIKNDVSHMEAGGNMQLTGASLDNVGYQNDVVFKVACYNKDYCRTLNPKDSSELTDPLFGDFGGHDMKDPPKRVWGANTVNTGLSGTIVAGGDLKGQFEGQVNNTTIIDGVLNYKPTDPDRSPSSGNFAQTTEGSEGKDGLKGPGNSNLSSSSSDLTTVDGKNNNLAYSGVTNPQGVDPGLHVTLPGFSGSGSTSINDILSSLTGGQALFRPNPNVTNGSSSVNNVSGGNIGNTTGNGGTSTGNTVNNSPTNTVTGTDVTIQNPVQSGNVNTSSVSSNSNYLIETRPQYTSVNEFYGSQYLLNHLDINGSYMFLGDAGFDTQYIQQQYIQATGQSYPGGTYMTASDAMKTLLDNASTESGKLGLQFGTALTAEQQAALNEDIVWYVPQVVDGQTVLVPQLYLSPKTDVLAGAAIKGKNVNITAGSITNSGLVEGMNSIALTATNGDISNIGGTIKGGNISLNAQNGSVINSDTVNNYLVNGGTGSYLGSQGQILASGTLGIQASDSITTHGGTIQSGSDLAMKAGTINIGSVELNAAASSVTHASDGTLSFVGNQTKNYGTTITAGGSASLQSTAGDLTLSGSTLNATGNVSLSSAGSIGLDAVTDSGLSDVKGHKSSAFNSSSFSDHNEYTTALSSNVISNGNITMGAKNDINLAGSVVLADGNTSLYAGHDVNLGSVTNTSSTSSSHKSSGLLQKEKEAGNSTKTEEIGSLVGAGKDVTIGAGHDLNIAGTVTGQNDVTLIAGNNLSTMATKDTTDDYYHKSTSGLGASFSGGLASVGYQSNKRTDTSKTTTWTSSEISAGHNLTSVSGGSSTFTGTTLSAGNDLSISGSSVNFDTVHNTVDQTHKESSVFGGLKVGLASDSAAGQAAQYGQAAVDMNGKGSAAGKTLNAMQGGYAVGNALANDGGGYGGGIISGTAQLGFGSSKYKSDYSQSTVVGSSATAGNNLSVVARGDNANDVHNGDLTATGADLSGKNVTLSGNNVTLQSDWDTTHSSRKGSSFGGAIGVEVNTKGDLGLAANGSGSQQHANGDSSSAVNTTVSATDKVTITAPGKTTINGGIVSGNQISVDTGNLDIISPQDTSHYNSSSSQVGGGLKVGIPGAGWGANGNYSNQTIKDDYQSTGKQQSGLYAGDGGVQVHVDDTTHLKGGVISSTGGNSYLDTGKLISENQENHSKWDATSTGGGLNLGTDALGGSLGPLGVIAGNMAANSGLITGGNRKQNDNSTTQSAISSEVKVNAGSTQGSYTTDVASADGHMDNNFDANKLSNELQNSQLGMQLVGEVMGQVSDALRDNGVPTFGEGGFGRLGLESAGNALIAAITGGDAGSAAAVTAAGGLVSAQTRLLAEQIGKQVSDDPQMQVLIANAISNAFASGGGALTDVAMGGDGLNGSSLASIMQAYNQSKDPNGGKIDETTQSVLSNLYDWALNTMEAASYVPGGPGEVASAALAIIYAAQGDYKNALVNLASVGFGIFDFGAGKIVATAGDKAAEQLLAGKHNTVIYVTETDVKGNITKQEIVEGQGNTKGGVAESSYTGTVWDFIKPTQDNYLGSVIPKSFEMSLPNGEKIWVHGNATKHMAEYAQYKAINNTPEAVRLSSQQELSSLQNALNTATQNGVKYDKLIIVGGWELKLSPSRQPGGLPALIHAKPAQ